MDALFVGGGLPLATHQRHLRGSYNEALLRAVALGGGADNADRDLLLARQTLLLLGRHVGYVPLAGRRAFGGRGRSRRRRRHYCGGVWPLRASQGLTQKCDRASGKGLKALKA